MDSFHDKTSMVFHAPVQRRHVSSRGVGGVTPGALAVPSALRGVLTSPQERLSGLLPALPTVLGACAHQRPHLPASPYMEPSYRPTQSTDGTPMSSLNFLLRGMRNNVNSSELRRPTIPTDASETKYSPYARQEYQKHGEYQARRTHHDYHDHQDHDHHGHDHDRRTHHRHVEHLERHDGSVRGWRGRLASDSSVATNVSSPSYASSSPSTQSSSLQPTPAGARARATDPRGAIQSNDKKKRKARICTTEGCTKYVVDHGLCIRHGGGKRCYIEGCDCRAQNRGLCWKHGGFTICKVDGCTKRAKSRGICWSHGGGTRCKRDECSKIAVSNGLCWAHGGGKRCVYKSCRKPASEKTNNFCNEHFACGDGGYDDQQKEDVNA